MYFKRQIEQQFLQASKTFPVVIITGARQTGKSTLCKTLLKKTHAYVSLEDPDIRQQALEDPRTFLKNFPAPVIIDEFQYAPNLPSYLQTIVDENRATPGQYILTGSQNFMLMHNVSQSLAGRAALLTLYPCSTTEIDGKNKDRSEPKDVADWILRGGYPELRAKKEIDRKLWCSSYIQLYLERDIRNIIAVGDLRTFERFLQLIAARTGQILNMSNLSKDAGVSVPTIKRWISVLEASYQIYLLTPYFTNLSKRIIKAPKIYFSDTALATYLMGIHTQENLMQGPYLGQLFETAIVMEHLKEKETRNDMTNLYYSRTKDGTEIDLIIEQGNQITAREIKSSRTLQPALGKNLNTFQELIKKPIKKQIFAPIPTAKQLTKEIEIIPWNKSKW